MIASEGGERAHFLLEQLIDQARQAGIDVPFSATTAYVNTIRSDQEERTPGNISFSENIGFLTRSRPEANAAFWDERMGENESPPWSTRRAANSANK